VQKNLGTPLTSNVKTYWKILLFLKPLAHPQIHSKLLHFHLTHYLHIAGKPIIYPQTKNGPV
jgi:hypothetical protein